MTPRRNYTKANSSPRLATTQPISVDFPASSVKADPPLAGVGFDELVVGALDVLPWDGEVVVPVAMEDDATPVEAAGLEVPVVADEATLELVP
jgi:hypothetical protein